MTPFNESDFVVTFFGECPESRVVRTWDRTLTYIDHETHPDGEYSVREVGCELHDPDHWTHLDDTDHDDTRHTFQQNEFFYCVGLSIIRLTDSAILTAALAPQGGERPDRFLGDDESLGAQR